MVYTEIKYPLLVSDKGSLTEVEKQTLGNFIILSGGSVLLELGFFKGVTTKFICNFLDINKIQGKLYAFDLPEVVSAVTLDEEIKKFVDKGLLELVPGWLPDSLRNWIKKHPGKSVDFVLDDAFHDYPSVYGELKLVWPVLSKSGFVLCHDYYAAKFPGVVYGVNKFARRHGACMVPLLSSPRTQAAGMGSVLVALRKKEYSTYSGLLSQEFYSFKVIMAKTWLWKKVLRPILK